MPVLNPIPRDHALIPWQRPVPVEPLLTFAPGAPSPAALAFLQGIARDIAAALGLQLEEIESEVASRRGPA